MVRLGQLLISETDHYPFAHLAHALLPPFSISITDVSLDFEVVPLIICYDKSGPVISPSPIRLMPTKPPSLSRDTPSLGPGDPTELLGPVMQSSYPDPLTLSQFTTPNKSMLEGGRRTLPESSTKPISLREATVEFDRAVEVARLRQGLMDTTNEWRVRCTLLEEKLKGKGKEVQQLEDEVESLKLETTTLKQQVEALTRSRYVPFPYLNTVL